MWELPAKSMPGSEIVDVEKMRIRGVYSSSEKTRLGVSTYFFLLTYIFQYPFSSTVPRYSCPSFFAHTGMSAFVPGSDEIVSRTAPTGIVAIALLVSSKGPGQDVPLASTTLSAVMLSSDKASGSPK